MSTKYFNRYETVKLKNARGRKVSSQRWLSRHLNDPYVQQAKHHGYRSRASFKLIQIQDKFNLFQTGQTILDLGAAPGGWSQMIASWVKGASQQDSVIGLDLLPIDPIAGVHLIQGDFLEPNIKELLREKTNQGVDGVVSDMAADTTGHAKTDHIRTIVLAQEACEIALEVLKEGGFFVSKVFQGGADHELLSLLKTHFKTIKHYKPPASRKESPEMYVIAQGYGRKE